MKIYVDVEENGAIAHCIECEVSPDETVEAVARQLAAQLDMEVDDLLADLETYGITFEKHQPIHTCLPHDHRIRQHRVCIDLHFESEQAVHHFSPQQRWARVHRWGCHHFQVAQDACANLELRVGAPDGPALNETLPLDVFSGCKTVWLVKPGPEQNG